MEWLVIAVVLTAAFILIAGFLIWRNIAVAAAIPKVGDAGPNFALPDQDGKTRTLADFRGHWLVLYFYPKDHTRGCTQQACGFRDDLHKLEAMGAQVVGVSVDDVTSHVAFAKKYSLLFPLLADTTGGVARRYGSIYDLGLAKFAKRNTFLIDPRGRIAKIYPSANASKNSREVIEELQKLRSNS